MKLNIDRLLTPPSDFGFHDYDHPARVNPSRWTLGPVLRTRDSGLLEQSNAAALIARLEEAELSEDWLETRAGHWACGWVDHLSFRVLEDDGETETEVYRWLSQWFDALADYPIADEEDFSRREDEALHASVRCSGQRHVRDDAGDDWVERIVVFLSAHDPRQLESRGDDGPSPDDDAVLDALRELDLVEREDAEG